MKDLLIVNLIIVSIVVIALILIKKNVDKIDKNHLLIISSLLIVISHYSSIIYHLIKDGTAIHYLESNPNLLIPIYPCNVVMIAGVVLAFVNKKSKLFSFLVDYVFLFGIVSATVGLFANVDFINNPTLRDYDVTKGLITHGLLLFNSLLIGVLGYFKLDFKKNVIHVLLFIVMMFVFGVYCNLIFEVIADYKTAYNVNSMFLIHSPFDDSKLLTYPLISLMAFVLYFVGLFIAQRLKNNHN